MSGPFWAYNIERTDENEKIFSFIGRLLYLATRFERNCKSASKQLGVEYDVNTLNNIDSFKLFINKLVSNIRDKKLYEEFLYVDDIVGQLPPIFERFYGSEGNRTCDQCGTVMPEQGQTVN